MMEMNLTSALLILPCVLMLLWNFQDLWNFQALWNVKVARASCCLLIRCVCVATEFRRLCFTNIHMVMWWAYLETCESHWVAALATVAFIIAHMSYHTAWRVLLDKYIVSTWYHVSIYTNILVFHDLFPSSDSCNKCESPGEAVQATVAHSPNQHQCYAHIYPHEAPVLIALWFLYLLWNFQDMWKS